MARGELSEESHKSEFSTSDRELGDPELTPLGARNGVFSSPERQ